MRGRLLLFVLTLRCGGSPAASPVAPQPVATSASAAASASSAGSPVGSAAPPAPAPTGGTVVVGDIPGMKKFEPRATIEDQKPALLACYNQVRASRPELSGKVTLRVVVNQAGRAVAVEAEQGGSANDPSLVSCLRDVLTAAAFPKPPGMAAILAPLLFRP